ncbi:MAG: hypothetical protein KAG10_00090 [Methylococcales bacterium]|nr:hypothetical protein [Methylococcales bacterium]MCK5924271.1 hypothetical protein [Methylococcales bacterium]
MVASSSTFDEDRDAINNCAMSLAEWEAYDIKIALNETGGNISLAAKNWASLE